MHPGFNIHAGLIFLHLLKFRCRPETKNMIFVRNVDHFHRTCVEVPHFEAFFGGSLFTPQKINIEPENDAREDYFPLLRVYSQVPC